MCDSDLDLDIDLLIDSATAFAISETTSATPAQIADRSNLPIWAIPKTGDRAPTPGPVEGVERRPLPWTQAEDQFLRQNLGILSESDIAARLNRSRNAVHLRWERDLNLPCPSKTPGYVTARQASDMLGVDVHAVCKWIRDGLLPAQIIPYGRRIRRIAIPDLRRFAATPRNWIYFKPDHVPDPDLRRLVDKARRRWGDEWLSTGQVADMHGLAASGPIVNRVHAGTLPAQRLFNNNWFVRRSHAQELRIWPRCGEPGRSKSNWTPAADAFLVLSRAVGLSYPDTARLMHRPAPSVRYHFHCLCRDYSVIDVIQSAGLTDITYNPHTHGLSAYWPAYRHHFPYYSRIIDNRIPPSRSSYSVHNILRSWISYLSPYHPILKQLNAPGTSSRRPPEFWESIYNQIQELDRD